jgi:tetratricopeptide (TPR) repeat protein
MRNKMSKSMMVISIIIIPLLFSCATTQQKQSESRDAEFYLNRGLDYVNKGQYDQGISDLTKAIEIDPRFARAYDIRSITYMAKSQWDQAMSDCNKALEINPRSASAYHSRGRVYMGKGQYEQAIPDFTRAIEINPNFALAYYNRGRSYYYKKEKEYDKSWEDIRKAQDLGWRVPPEFLEELRKASGR